MTDHETFKSADDILDFAIAREQQSHDWYMELAGKATRDHMKRSFEQFAKEELGHKAKLEGVKTGKRIVGSATKVMDLKMTDYLVADDTGDAEIDYQQALLLAMKKEKAAFKLYSDLAARVDDPGLAELFSNLAQEEAKHKLRFEVEYDEVILTDN